MAAFKPEKIAKTARKFVGALDGAVNLAVLIVLLLLLAFGFYCLWDSEQVYEAAAPANYELYKPTADSASFDELQRLSPDVFGWLTVYGTAIDYPLLQGEDNLRYINTDAQGDYSLSGAIFLDYRSAKDFSDYNSVIHGHHMAASAMFGDLSKFTEQSFFDSHEYGNLYVGGRSYGLVFFEFALVDAYDDAVYAPAITEKDAQAAFLEMLMGKSLHLREAEQLSAEHIVILSTCSSDMTNGRHILAGYLTEQTYDDPFRADEDAQKPAQEGLSASKVWQGITNALPLWVIMLLILLLLVAVYIIFELCTGRIRQKKTFRERSCKKEG